MSDIVDMMEESVATVIGNHGSFKPTFRSAESRHLMSARELHLCSCGGRAAYADATRYGGPAQETLACAGCGNRVGPFRSRQALAQAWQLGGWSAHDAASLARSRAL